MADVIKNNNSSLSLMSRRLGVLWPKTAEEIEEEIEKGISTQGSVKNLQSRLENNGGRIQQDRMIYDKLRTLDRVVLYSYQGASIKHVGEEEEDLPVRALINPNKLKQDYDDKVLSVRYNFNFKPGDVFEWLGTGTYWLIYLQDLTELAYFRGDIRRCSYQISWKTDSGTETTYAAVRGPVETRINYIQKHTISVDEPNHSLNILIPRTEEALKYFRRYSKFYLKGTDEGSPEVCWRVEALDWISTPGILEIAAVEYYINDDEDDVENGIAGGLIVEPVNPNPPIVEETIIGETFMKPRIPYTYEYSGSESGEWVILNEKKLPLRKEVDGNTITITWIGNVSGQFILTFGETQKTIVVESLF